MVEKPKRERERERGSAMMELAVVLPLLLVTTVGLVDFGRAAYEAIEVENAAHSGAAYGARSKGLAADEEGIEDAAIADFGEDVDADDVDIESERYCECSDGDEVDCDDGCDDGATPLMYVRVRVDKDFETLLEYPGVPAEINLAREVHLRVQ